MPVRAEDRVLSLNGFLRLLVAATTVFLGACQSVYFGGVQKDRSGYADVIGESWKEQMLLNIVKVRYLDVPVYLDIQSVVSSYTMELESGINAIFFPQPAVRATDSNNFGLSGKHRFSESPTISYVPLSGERFANSVLRPLPPELVFAFVTAGGHMEFLLKATVQSINGIANASSSPSTPHRATERFSAFIEILGRVVEAGAVGLRIEKDAERSQAYLFFRRTAEDAVDGDIAALKKLLGLDLKRDEFQLVYGVTQGRTDTIAVLTRSIQGITGELSAGVTIPDQDLLEGRATRRIAQDGEGGHYLLQVGNSSERPADAFAAVKYRNRWFWVDDRDLTSKRTFRFLLMFASMSETGALPQAPLLTIPTR